MKNNYNKNSLSEKNLKGYIKKFEVEALNQKLWETKLKQEVFSQNEIIFFIQKKRTRNMSQHSLEELKKIIKIERNKINKKYWAWKKNVCQPLMEKFGIDDKVIHRWEYLGLLEGDFEKIHWLLREFTYCTNPNFDPDKVDFHLKELGKKE